MVEQMGRHLMASPLVSSTLAAQALIAGGTEAQMAHWLPKLAEGAIGSLALSEAHGDWDLQRYTQRRKLVMTPWFYRREALVAWAQSADVIIASVMLTVSQPWSSLTAQEVLLAAAPRIHH